jgi:signal transduction histidine kinase
MKWVVFGIAVAVVGSQGVQIIFPLLDYPQVKLVLVGYTIIHLAWLAVPLSIAIAMLRFRLWDIDPIINRTLVYGALTACIVGIYVLVVGSLGTLFQARGNLLISLVATGLVAVLFQPLRARLQRSVNRLMYGERDDPYAVVARLGQRLEATLTPEAVLPAIVETVKEVLKLPYAAITVRQKDTFPVAASAGIAPEPHALVRLPLVSHTALVGELLLALRAPGETFSEADQRLLHDLANQIGVAVEAVCLTADLQRLTVDLQHSRERLVLAREEERRRIRRDLHDGLGPTLAALAFTAGTVGDLIPTNPQAATALVTELQHAIRATVADIRRLVYDLRPPTLDEVGLVAAIRERAVQSSTPAQVQECPNAQHGLQVLVEAPERLPPLPAAVEVAAYRIVQEALTNVIRHAQAQMCIVHLALAEVLQVEIIDDGIGVPPDHHAGVGLRSMRERAAELGGTCVIEALAGGGTRVCARLPVGTLIGGISGA